MSSGFSQGSVRHINRMQNEYRSEAQRSLCGHKPKDWRTMGYIGWDEWAEKQVEEGKEQRQCPKCKLWLFPCEM